MITFKEYLQLQEDTLKKQFGALGSGKTFNEKLQILETYSNLPEAKEIRGYLNKSNTFFDDSGNATILEIVDEVVESKGTSHNIKTIKSKHQKESLKTFFSIFDSEIYKKLFIALFAVLRNKKVFESKTKKILENYLPSNVLSDEPGKNVLSHNFEIFRQNAISFSYEGKGNNSFIYKKGNSISVLAYVILFYSYKPQKTKAIDQWTTEVYGLPIGSNVGKTPSWFEEEIKNKKKSKNEDQDEEEEDGEEENDAKSTKKSENDEIPDDETQGNDEEPEEERIVDSSILKMKPLTSETPEELQDELEDLKSILDTMLNSFKKTGEDFNLKNKEGKPITLSILKSGIENLYQEGIKNLNKEKAKKFKELQKKFSDVETYSKKRIFNASKAKKDLGYDFPEEEKIKEGTNFLKSVLQEADIPKEYKDTWKNKRAVKKINVDSATYESGSDSQSPYAIANAEIMSIVDNITTIVDKKRKDVEQRALILDKKFKMEFKKYYDSADTDLNKVFKMKKNLKVSFREQLRNVMYNINRARGIVRNYASRLNYLLEEFEDTIKSVNAKINVELQELENKINSEDFKRTEAKVQEKIAKKEGKAVERSEKKEQMKEKLSYGIAKKKERISVMAHNIAKKIEQMKENIRNALKKKTPNMENPISGNPMENPISGNKGEENQENQQKQKKRSSLYFKEEVNTNDINQAIINASNSIFSNNKKGNDSIVFSVNKMKNSNDAESIANEAKNLRSILTSNEVPPITIPSYATSLAQSAKLITDRVYAFIDDNKIEAEQADYVINTMENLFSFLEDGLDRFESELINKISNSEQQQPTENEVKVPEGARTAIVKSKEEREDEDDEEEEEEEEPKNLLALAKKKLQEK
jgi:hypothetical protein